ncbi:MAG: response regulator [Thermoanaerobaculia bacterium]|jgi:FixJ family two-component response regulator|nr:response regulator [Thermoanaerobaculia bacterium]MBP9826108.1 response regulator [Thermoanaerobaculia bacterium]
MSMPGRKVLVVEDDASLREAIERLLGAAGIESKMYPSAEELLANGAAATAACIVSDWKLPAANGLEMLDAIHARGWQPPLILITAHDGPGLREEAARHGVAAFLAKPFRGTALIDAIRSATAPADLR